PLQSTQEVMHKILPVPSELIWSQAAPSRLCAALTKALSPQLSNEYQALCTPPLPSPLLSSPLLSPPLLSYPNQPGTGEMYLPTPLLSTAFLSSPLLSS